MPSILDQVIADVGQANTAIQSIFTPAQKQIAQNIVGHVSAAAFPVGDVVPIPSVEEGAIAQGTTQTIPIVSDALKTAGLSATAAGLTQDINQLISQTTIQGLLAKGAVAGIGALTAQDLIKSLTPTPTSMGSPSTPRVRHRRKHYKHSRRRRY